MCRHVCFLEEDEEAVCSLCQCISELQEIIREEPLPGRLWQAVVWQLGSMLTFLRATRGPL